MVSRRNFLTAAVGGVAGLFFEQQAEGQALQPFSKELLDQVIAETRKLPLKDMALIPNIMAPQSVISRVPESAIVNTIKDKIVRGNVNPNALIPIPAYTLDFQKQIVEREPLINLCITRHKIYPALRTKYQLIAETLIANGADVNLHSVPYRSDAPLTHAARSNQPEMINLLLAHKADPNAKDADGNTALHYAYGFKNQPIVDALHKAGANPNLKNKKGTLPKDMANRKLDPRLLAGNVQEMISPTIPSEKAREV